MAVRWSLDRMLMMAMIGVIAVLCVILAYMIWWTFIAGPVAVRTAGMELGRTTSVTPGTGRS
jgi:hypothetical protein